MFDVIEPLLNQASQYLIDQFKKQSFEIQTKNQNDWVTEADLYVDQMLTTSLEKAFPDIQVISEEKTSSHNYNQEDTFWIIDPIDGTLNFAHGFPIFGITIALVKQGKPVLGWIELPMFGQRFFAEIGKKSTCNQATISVSNIIDTKASLVEIGQPHTYSQGLPELVTLVSQYHQSFRRSGSAVFNFAQVACGAVDIFCASKLNIWDIAAGVLLVEMAGGKVFHRNGQPFSDLTNGNLIACNGKVSIEHLFKEAS
ncbi:MAG: inositol monophosphatase [Bdellovibrionales bacterium]|nr:inositol monophosphatase [Bdellovibrionales bacterium]